MSLDSPLLPAVDILTLTGAREYSVTSSSGVDAKAMWLTRFAAHNSAVAAMPWHVFSYGEYPRLEGRSAVDEMARTHVKAVTIFSPSIQSALTVELIDSVFFDVEKLFLWHKKYSASLDVYLSHYRFKWTFVLTHEDGFGPFFARSVTRR